MTCRNCGAAHALGQRFCSECGSSVGDAPPSQNISGNSGVSGAIYQAGGDIHVVGGSPAEPTAEYQAKWSWRSPLTLAVLTWVSVALGLLGVAAGWQGLYPMVNFFRGSTTEQPPVAWLYAFMGVMLVLLLSLWLRGVAKQRTQHLPSVSWLPALTGWGGRIGLAKLEGSCPRDGAALRFYDKPIEWVKDPTTGRQKTTRRQMAAECSRNPDHWWRVDKADGWDS